MGHVRFTLHPPPETPARDGVETISGDAAAAGRFDTPIARPLGDDELIYLDGSFTVAELKRLVRWVQGD